MQQSFHFPTQERLKSRKQIGLLFANRQSIGAYPLRIFWAKANTEMATPVQIAFSVSKRTFKQANSRNRYKRLMREIYRLHRQDLNAFLEGQEEQLHLMLVYVGKEKADFKTIQNKFLYLIDRLKKEIV